MPTITQRWPTNPITPHGAYHLLAGTQPMFAYRSYDDSVVFNLMGPLAHVDPTQPESPNHDGCTIEDVVDGFVGVGNDFIHRASFVERGFYMKISGAGDP